MDIGTIIAGVQALGNLMGANDPVPNMTPAQTEQKKPKQLQQPNTVVFYPVSPVPQPMVLGVPPMFWSQQPPAITQQPMGQPTFSYPSLADLYALYFGTRR
jgi:hypothetical protein